MTLDSKPLPIRIEQHGWVVAQDGVLLSLFLPGSHTEVAESVGDLYDQWLELVDAESLQWVRGWDDWKPLTSRGRSSVRKRMRGTGLRKTDDRVAVKGGGGPDDVMVHGFDYWGSERPTVEEASFVDLYFTTDWVRERGIDVFSRIALDLASRVRFSSGYASLALHVDMVIPGFVDGLAFEHPGLDIHANEYTSLGIGDLVRGAYWLTFIGPAALRKLGSAASLRRTLGPEISVTEVGWGLAIQAGDELRPGQASAGDRLPLTRQVAQVIEPVTLHQTKGAFGFTSNDRYEKFLAWQRRHLTEIHP